MCLFRLKDRTQAKEATTHFCNLLCFRVAYGFSFANPSLSVLACFAGIDVNGIDGLIVLVLGWIFSVDHASLVH